MELAFKKLARRLVSIGSKDEVWCRVVMNRETRRLVESLTPNELKVLEISGTSWKERGLFKTLAWPYRAARHVFEMLNRGGHFLITTPFLNRVHDMPIDCSRWTETGLKYFLAECGFPMNAVRTGSWGNRACVRANFRKWVRYRPWFHSLKNEPNFPIVVWALASKSVKD